MKRRILFSDDGTLSDWSVNMQEYRSGTNTFSMVAAEDYIFIGSRLPFNHIYFKFDGTDVNAEASVLSVAYWDSGQFRNAVDVIDETSVGGATFAQSGFVTWSSDKSYGWVQEDTNYSGNSVTGLTDVEIYDLYWCRLSVSADLTADVTFSWVGQKFSDDADLRSEHPGLVRTDFKTAYEAGKTDWEEQHIKAAKLLVDDLIDKNLIIEKDQILQKEDLTNVAVKKVAQIIYRGMGQDYEEDRKLAEQEYYSRLNKALPKVDQNANAMYDRNERLTFGKLIR